MTDARHRPPDRARDAAELEAARARFAKAWRDGASDADLATLHDVLCPHRAMPHFDDLAAPVAETLLEYLAAVPGATHAEGNRRDYARALSVVLLLAEATSEPERRRALLLALQAALVQDQLMTPTERVATLAALVKSGASHDDCPEVFAAAEPMYPDGLALAPTRLNETFTLRLLGWANEPGVEAAGLVEEAEVPALRLLGDAWSVDDWLINAHLLLAVDRYKVLGAEADVVTEDEGVRLRAAYQACFARLRAMALRLDASGANGLTELPRLMEQDPAAEPFSSYAELRAGLAARFKDEGFELELGDDHPFWVAFEAWIPPHLVGLPGGYPGFSGSRSGTAGAERLLVDLGQVGHESLVRHLGHVAPDAFVAEFQAVDLALGARGADEQARYRAGVVAWLELGTSLPSTGLQRRAWDLVARLSRTDLWELAPLLCRGAGSRLEEPLDDRRSAAEACAAALDQLTAAWPAGAPSDDVKTAVAEALVRAYQGESPLGPDEPAYVERACALRLLRLFEHPIAPGQADVLLFALRHHDGSHRADHEWLWERFHGPGAGDPPSPPAPRREALDALFAASSRAEVGEALRARMHTRWAAGVAAGRPTLELLTCSLGAAAAPALVEAIPAGDEAPLPWGGTAPVLLDDRLVACELLAAALPPADYVRAIRDRLAELVASGAWPDVREALGAALLREVEAEGAVAVYEGLEAVQESIRLHGEGAMGELLRKVETHYLEHLEHHAKEVGPVLSAAGGNQRVEGLADACLGVSDEALREGLRGLSEDAQERLVESILGMGRAGEVVVNWAARAWGGPEDALRGLVLRLLAGSDAAGERHEDIGAALRGRFPRERTRAAALLRQVAESDLATTAQRRGAARALEEGALDGEAEVPPTIRCLAACYRRDTDGLQELFARARAAFQTSDDVSTRASRLLSVVSLAGDDDARRQVGDLRVRQLEGLLGSQRSEAIAREALSGDRVAVLLLQPGIDGGALKLREADERRRGLDSRLVLAAVDLVYLEAPARLDRLLDLLGDAYVQQGLLDATVEAVAEPLQRLLDLVDLATSQRQVLEMAERQLRLRLGRRGSLRRWHRLQDEVQADLRAVRADAATPPRHPLFTTLLLGEWRPAHLPAGWSSSPREPVPDAPPPPGPVLVPPLATLAHYARKTAAQIDAATKEAVAVGNVLTGYGDVLDLRVAASSRVLHGRLRKLYGVSWADWADAQFDQLRAFQDLLKRHQGLGKEKAALHARFLSPESRFQRRLNLAGALCSAYDAVDLLGKDMGTKEWAKLTGDCATLVEWLQGKGSRHVDRLIGKIEKRAVEAGGKALALGAGDKVVLRSGKVLAASSKVVPIVGNVISCGLALSDYQAAVEKGDSTEAWQRGLETMGWACLAGAAVLGACGVTSPLAAGLLVVGGLLLVTSYGWDLLEGATTPNAYEALASDLGYACA